MFKKLVIAQWVDSTYYSCENATKDDLKDLIPKVLISGGLLVNENEHGISICQDIEPETEFLRTVLTIPKISILDYQIIEVEIKPKKIKSKK